MELPELFIRRMQELLKDDFPAFMDSYQHHQVNRALRINTRKISEEHFLKGFKEKLFKLPFGKALYQIPEEWLLGNHPYFHAGGMYIQEPSACLPALAPDIRPDSLVLDLCAAPGGKSTQILDLIPDGLLIANEINHHRARILAGNIERMGYRNAIVTCNRPEDFLSRFKNRFDLVVVDAPCSGEGMFRKDPDAIKEWSLENVRLCMLRQQEILDVASELVKPGGQLVYSTCTFSREENEDNIAYLLKNHPLYAMAEVREEVALNSSPAFPPFETSGRRVFPHKSLGEGHFISLMRRIPNEEQVPANGSQTFQPLSRNMLAQIMPAINGIVSGVDGNRLYLIRENIHYLTFSIPSLENLNVLLCGVKMGSLAPDRRFLPDHHLSHAFPWENYPHVINLTLSDERVKDYLAGYEINTDDTEKGYVVVGVDSMALGLGKVVNGIIKNYYPKGLRNLVKDFEKY